MESENKDRTSDLARDIRERYRPILNKTAQVEWEEAEAKRAEAWDVIQACLRGLSQSEPSGDDAVFDYWPNALLCVQALYENFYQEEGTGVIPEFFLHHLDESVGVDLTMRAVNLILNSEVKVSDWQTNLDDYVLHGYPYDMPAIKFVVEEE